MHDAETSLSHRLLLQSGLKWALPAGLILAVVAHFIHMMDMPTAVGDPIRSSMRALLWILAGYLFWKRSRLPGEPSDGWNWIALSCLVRAGGLVAYLAYPIPFMRLLLSDAATLMLAAGLLRWFEQGLFWGGGIRRVLDGIIATLAVLTMAWGSLEARLNQGPTTLQPVLIHVSVLYAMLLGIIITQALLDPRRLLGPLGWVGLFLVGEPVVHILAQRAGQLPSDSLHQVLTRNSPIMVPVMLMAPFARWTRDALTREEGRGQHLWSVILVYVPFGAATLRVLLSLRTNDPVDPILVALLCGMSFVLLARQIITLKDLASSCNILQTQLDIRTRSLKEHQLILERNHRMNLLSTLGAGLAHDFNNLITVIINEAERGRTDEVVAAAQRAADLTRHLLSFARPESRGVELFELGDLIQSRMRLFEKVCRRGLTLSLTREPEACWMEVDPLRIEQVMLNLITNAADAIQGEGFIRIRLRRLASGQAFVEVEDSGPGMSPEVRERLFQPFFTTKAQGVGTGLGLASVQAIMQELGGSVDVVTEVGLGTTFRLRLPTVELD